MVPHTPLEHVLTTHSLPVAGQSTAVLQATQVPEPLHTEPPLSLQEVPGDALLVPHVLAVHVLTRHFVAWAAQSPPTLHATQVPVASQTAPPLSVQAVPCAASFVPQHPVLHESTLHAEGCVAVQSASPVHVVDPGQALPLLLLLDAAVVVVVVVLLLEAAVVATPPVPVVVLLLLVVATPPVPVVAPPVPVVVVLLVVAPPVPVVVLLVAAPPVLLVAPPVLLVAPPVLVVAPPVPVVAPPPPPPVPPELGILLRSTDVMSSQPVTVAAREVPTSRSAVMVLFTRTSIARNTCRDVPIEADAESSARRSA